MSQTIHIARITIQFTTAFHVGTGKGANGADVGVVLDPNGLPSLPGSSIQGVLRQTWQDLGFDTAVWFGFDDKHDFAKNDPKLKNGRRSHVEVSWGLIHDRNDLPIEGLISPETLDKDLVLRDASHPTLRDHVRINDRRTAEDRGKFDELAISAGHRFTFELKLISPNGDDAAQWNQLLGSLSHPLVRFGGKTRRGFGAFNPVRILAASFALANETQRNAFLDWPVTLAETPVAPEFLATDTAGPNYQNHSCDLTAAGLWMIGGGADDDAGSAPVRTTRIDWTNDKGKPNPYFLIPGSSIKGALAHRTCFHANRLAKVFADEPGLDLSEVTGSNNAVVRELFGEIVDHKKECGTPGRVFIDDVYLPVPESDSDLFPAQNHVAIDPFTGGAKDTALFQDRPLLGGEITVPIFLQTPQVGFKEMEITRINSEPKKACPKASFEAALENLKQGSLGIGAHSSRGYGFFKSSPAKAS